MLDIKSNSSLCSVASKTKRTSLTAERCRWIKLYGVRHTISRDASHPFHSELLSYCKSRAGFVRKYTNELRSYHGIWLEGLHSMTAVLTRREAYTGINMNTYH